MSFLSRFGLTSFACLLACCSTMVIAQTGQAKSALDQLLSRIEANTEQYKASVPSFLCDEHIVSQELHDGSLKHETTVDALFRVTRSTSQPGTLDESREVKAIDGRPSGSKKISMPISFSGGFSGALAKFLSADSRQCFEYQPDLSQPSPSGTEAFTFVARQAALKEPACASIQPGTTGKFVIDSATAQVTHIERTVPYTVGKDQSVLGTAAVDFAPVTLNGNTFWLPFTVSASTSETPKTPAFRFTAHYSNYHRFSASSTILPAVTNSSAQPQSR
jgi:hypothetical protein